MTAEGPYSATSMECELQTSSRQMYNYESRRSQISSTCRKGPKVLKFELQNSSLDATIDQQESFRTFTSALACHRIICPVSKTSACCPSRSNIDALFSGGIVEVFSLLERTFSYTGAAVTPYLVTGNPSMMLIHFSTRVHTCRHFSVRHTTMYNRLSRICSTLLLGARG